MIKQLAAWIGGAALALIGVTSVAKAEFKTVAPETVGFSASRLQRLDSSMRAEIDAGKFAGISIMIARHGKVVKDSRYGYQDLTTHKPMRADAIFRIASMTKPVTGVALMILFEEGKWQLDDPIAKFIPEFADLKVATPEGPVALRHPPTMRELVTSTAGFAAGFDYGSSNPAVDEAYAKAKLSSGALAEMIAKLARLPLESQPGAKFRYGTQHDIQAAVVERISGQTFDRFLAERLFQPLAMKDTGFGVPAAKRDRIAPLYTYDKDLKLVLAANQGSFYSTVPGETPAFLSGSGGLYSSISDYMRFALMLANGGELEGVRILSPSTVKLMMSDMLPPGANIGAGEPFVGVGYGVDLGVILDPARATFSGGALGKGTVFWTGAHGSWFWVDPVNDLVVVGMVQQELAGSAHTGLPTPAPDIRAMSRSLVYQALVDPSR